MTNNGRQTMSKKALCIGINDYPGTQNDLSGCVNDANDWAAALTARGFAVTKLIDAQATKAAMVSAISGLVGGAAKGDSDDLDAGMPRARFLPPSVWMKADELPASRVSSLPIISGMSRSGGDLLMAGCLDTQFSWDTRFKGRPNGAFTYYALKTLAALPAGASYAQWFKAITPTYLPTNQLPQNPQLFGSRTARAWKVFA